MAASTLSRTATLLVGVVVAAALIGVELLLGMPPGLAQENGLPAFANVLTLNAVAVLAPFIYIAARTSDKTDSALDAGTTGLLSLMPVMSLIAWAGLWVGLDFRSFIVAHAILVAVIALAWIAWTWMRVPAQDETQRRSVRISRRTAIDTALTDIMIACDALPIGQRLGVRQAAGRLQDEMRLLTPAQTERAPQLVARIRNAVELLHDALGRPVDDERLARALEEADRLMENLKAEISEQG